MNFNRLMLAVLIFLFDESTGVNDHDISRPYPALLHQTTTVLSVRVSRVRADGFDGNFPNVCSTSDEFDGACAATDGTSHTTVMHPSSVMMHSFITSLIQLPTRPILPTASVSFSTSFTISPRFGSPVNDGAQRQLDDYFSSLLIRGVGIADDTGFPSAGESFLEPSRGSDGFYSPQMPALRRTTRQPSSTRSFRMSQTPAPASSFSSNTGARRRTPAQHRTSLGSATRTSIFTQVLPNVSRRNSRQRTFAQNQINLSSPTRSSISSSWRSTLQRTSTQLNRRRAPPSTSTTMTLTPDRTVTPECSMSVRFHLLSKLQHLVKVIGKMISDYSTGYERWLRRIRIQSTRTLTRPARRRRNVFRIHSSRSIVELTDLIASDIQCDSEAMFDFREAIEFLMLAIGRIETAFRTFPNSVQGREDFIEDLNNIIPEMVYCKTELEKYLDMMTTVHI